MRIHGTTAQRPAEMFTELEAACLLPVPQPYDQPIFTRVKVHRDYHSEVARSLYSLPEHLIGRYLDARADSELVKFYTTGSGGGRLVKTHPRQPPGGRSTDPEDLPEHKAGYAMRDLSRLIAVCAGHGTNIGIYAERLLDDPLPWTRMRSVYRLQGLVRRYGRVCEDRPGSQRPSTRADQPEGRPHGTPAAHGDSRSASETRAGPTLSAMWPYQSRGTCSPSKRRLIRVSDSRSASMDSRPGSS